MSNIEKDNQIKFEELKQVYQKSKVFDTKDNKTKEQLAQKMADMTAYLERITNLEKELHALNSDI